MNNITKAFFGVSVLRGVDFDLDRGEVHVLLGENGAGKSTLMKILSGAYQLDSGSIVLDGATIDPATLDPKAAENLGIVTVYQNFHLIPHMSVAENLSLTRFTQQRGFIRWKQVNAHAREVLERIDFPIDLAAKVRDLPVSQKQMLEIAIALSKNAKILVMDEPTAALSRKEIEILFDTLTDVKARGIGIIYISHKLEEVKVIGDRITVLRDGVNVATMPAGDADLDEVIGLMIGKELHRDEESREIASQEELFRVSGLRSHSFATPVSFKVNRNEVLGITGVVGSGKTELAEAIFGLERLNDGAVFFRGNQVHIDSPRKAVELGIGYLPEDRDADGLCLNLGIKENLSMVFLAKMKGLLFNTTDEKQTARMLIDSIGIRAADISQQVKYLSGGNKQKVVFGKWLTARCALLILDEPTIGIDIGARSEIYDLIREFVSQEDRSVIFVSSDVAEILDVSDRILVMSGRNLVVELDPKQTTKQEIMQYCLRANTMQQ
ncbi:MAG: sugar ABC transporter ATP-binding protein [Caldilinea sp.]